MDDRNIYSQREKGATTLTESFDQKKDIHYYGCTHVSSISAYFYYLEKHQPCVIVVPEKEFDSIEQSFLFFNPEVSVFRLPALNPLFPSLAEMMNRSKWLHQALYARPNDVFLCSQKSLLQKTIPTSEFQKNTFFLQEQSQLPTKKQLLEIGYQEVSLIEERGCFCQKGGILDIFSSIGNHPIRIEAIGDQIGSIYIFCAKTNRNIKRINSAHVPPVYEAFILPDQKLNAVKQLKKIKNFPSLFFKKISSNVFFPEQALLIDFLYSKPEQGIDYLQNHASIWVSSQSLQEEVKNEFFIEKDSYLFELSNHFYFKKLSNRFHHHHVHPILKESQSKWPVHTFSNSSWPSDQELSSQFVCIATPSDNQLKQIELKLKQKNFIPKIVSHSQNSWHDWRQEQMENPLVVHLIPSFIPYHFQIEDHLFLKGDQLLNKLYSSGSLPKKYSSMKMNALYFSEIQKGDLVVDKIHGVGLYQGLKTLSLQEKKAEYVEIEYKNKDRLYVPISQAHRLFQFKTKMESKVLDQLGTPYWSQKIAKTHQFIQNLVVDLMKMHLKRSRIQRPAFFPPSEDFLQFEKDFLFEETPDQLKSIQDILKSMMSSHPMDRLIIGDSGYGKTEVAMRACFKAVEDGYQVVFLAPTTILSLQHFKNFKNRFSKWPFRIELLNRLVSSSKRKQLLHDLAQQKIDILIGSHRLLSSDVQFKNLGLVIVDEEHRFGVKQKEKLKKIKMDVDCVYLSATPIPRTLSMSLSGAKDISVIQTPPKNRVVAKIFTMHFDPNQLKQAIMKEIHRGGQVIFVHNRIQSLQAIHDRLLKLLPDISIQIAHGQMSEMELESGIVKFFNHECDLLLCTTIVESGMDFSKVNTIIINDAHLFGLAQLYQLKGRVGRRSYVQPYCYLILPECLDAHSKAVQRLNALQSHHHVGSGYHIARHDLEIRGGGEFLGAKQSGHISHIGYDLFLDMMDRSLNKDVKEDWSVEMSLPWSAYIPSSYIPHDKIRLMYYKYLCDLDDMSQLVDFECELKDSFGTIPEEVKNLIGQILIQNECKKLKIKEIKVIKDYLYIKTKKEQKRAKLPEKKSWLDVYDYLCKVF